MEARVPRAREAPHWMSITQTRRKNALPLRGFVTRLYASHLQGKPPPSVFRGGPAEASPGTFLHLSIRAASMER